ncbi:MAG: sn-glycerol-3-phosphate ABC transporter ATP-binding protein UgpC [Clostridia bacterium]|nr:sn-glycerol-3-phosphate ABC transporter ATP-binding protein UgpC [Clostridia bacterium]
MANLSLKHIYKVYPNGTKAVNDFNMQIEDKEFIVFVGPSGCGKSTTLRMIAGLEEISAGELKIGDVVVNELEPKERDIAMVFQNYALYPHMTIYDNMAFGLQMQKMPKDEINRRVTEAAEILDITEYLKRKPKEMSGGQRQRVALGRAIVREPKVMLLDEPLSNLDAKLRTQMRSEIVKLHNKLNTTFVYVTHDQVEAMTMGTRIVVMKLGFVQQIDTPKNLYMYPANKFVAGFIGTPQMNFFNGTLKKDGDKVYISFAGSEAKITAPYEMMQKTTPQYLDGEKVVCIGLRAEDISLDPEDIKNSKTNIKVKISHTEELGTETLVYGDINLDYDGIAETETRIIIKAAGFKDFKSGEIVEAALNLSAVHLFDAETEESILPRIPKYNYVDCEIKGGNLTFAGQTVQLPSAIKCEDGKAELLLPPDSITFDGDIPAELESCENVNGTILLALKINGKKLFAISDSEISQQSIKIGVDLKKIIIRKNNEDIVVPMPEINCLSGTFAMEKVVQTVEIDGKLKKKKMPNYYMVIENEKFAAPQDVANKMFGAFSGRKVFNTAFRYEFTPYDFTVGDSGISATVTEVIDYGKEKFLKCSVGENTLYVFTDKPLTGEIKLVPDMTKVSVVEQDREIRIV